ncbi:MAG: hypothetical protein CL607_24355 [Anaerolineaceae bacterium]|nr:hypothetical protein [Anaerolineaceae bacterium]
MLSRSLRQALALLFIVGLLPTGGLKAQESSLFELFGDSPIATRGGVTDWYSDWNEPAGIVVHDEQFYLFWNGSGATDIKGIGYKSSHDGYEWTNRSHDAPLYTGADLDYVGSGVAGSSVLIDDGQWLSYFYTKDRNTFPMGGGDISRATSDSAEGPWQRSESVLLARGSEGEWDAEQISYPEVLRTEDGYVMYFAGFMPSGATAIGMATSSDGIDWVKYDDPTTTEPPYAESDPIIVGEDSENATMPNVVATDDGWVMIYKDNPTGNILLALSEDGLHWEPQDRQVFGIRDIPRARAIGFMSLLHHEETFYLYVEVATVRGGTDIYLATYDGNFFEADS